MRRLKVIVLGGLAAAVLAGAAAVLPFALHHEPPTPAGHPGSARPVVDAHGSVVGLIEAAQNRLRELPGDWATWAELGSAYVQQALITADPTYYPKADDALDASLRLRANDNWPAMVGQGALANARHDYTDALAWGQRAQQANANSGGAYGVIVDALTHLGRYDEARDAVRRMLDVQPGVASLRRAAYDLELHGDNQAAEEALQQALAQATQPADIAFCRYYLGELAFDAGAPKAAVERFQAAISADPRDQLAFAGLAKAHAALGQTGDAIDEYAKVVRVLPLPDLLVEYGDLLASVGRTQQAAQQYDLMAIQQELLSANGVTDHLLLATFLADHGQPAEALENAEAEWALRPSVEAADALAWALHRNGRDEEALPYADTANSLGWRNASFHYHRGVIRSALGDDGAARDDLAEALATNPYFDVLQAPAARSLLSTLDESE